MKLSRAEYWREAGNLYKDKLWQNAFFACGRSGEARICTIHGGNGITTLNLKLFLPLLKDFSIIAPDVVGMPGKSAPYRNISNSKDEYGIWMKEVLDHYKVDKISFVVSSYSSAMFLSFAKSYPEMVDKALLLVPS